MWVFRCWCWWRWWWLWDRHFWTGRHGCFDPLHHFLIRPLSELMHRRSAPPSHTDNTPIVRVIFHRGVVIRTFLSGIEDKIQNHDYLYCIMTTTPRPCHFSQGSSSELSDQNIQIMITNVHTDSTTTALVDFQRLVIKTKRRYCVCNLMLIINNNFETTLFFCILQMLGWTGAKSGVWVSPAHHITWDGPTKASTGDFLPTV